MGKNALSLLLTVGGAWWFASAGMALAGVCLSMTGSLIASRRSLVDTGASPRAARRGLAIQALRYAVPIIVANLLYQIIPLVDRALIAERYGFAESGQFSLAYDLGIRIVLAVGIDARRPPVPDRGPNRRDTRVRTLPPSDRPQHGDRDRHPGPDLHGVLARPAELRTPRRAARLPRPLRAFLHLSATGLFLLPAHPLRRAPRLPDSANARRR